MDPEQLSGQKLGNTILQLLGTYEELKPSAAKVSAHVSKNAASSNQAQMNLCPEQARACCTLQNNRREDADFDTQCVANILQCVLWDHRY